MAGVFVAEGLPVAWVLLIRRKVPESPRWFEARGRIAEAEQVMQEIELAVERASGAKLPQPASSGVEDEQAQGGFSLWELFKPLYSSAR